MSCDGRTFARPLDFREPKMRKIAVTKVGLVDCFTDSICFEALFGCIKLFSLPFRVRIMSSYSSSDSQSAQVSDPNFPDKLVGYEWYRSIGSPKYVVAPMVDASELAYRMLTRRYGATLVYTQMFNATMFADDKVYRKVNWETCPQDRPLIVQFAGHDPDKLLRSAKFVEDHCDAVDINLGCPQGIAKKGRYGAFLMEELDLLATIVSTLAKNLKVPVTCKTRIFKNEDGSGDFERSIRLCETLVNAGASLITIHGRTREEKGQHVKHADWDMIRRIKDHFRGRVPVVANGGIGTMDDVNECLRITGVDGVMSSEGILENPSIFSRNLRYIDAPDVHGAPQQQQMTADGLLPYSAMPAGKVPVRYVTQLDLTDEYLELCKVYPPFHFRTMRSHLQKFLHRYLQNHTDMRDLLTESYGVDEFQVVVARIREVLVQRGETAITAITDADADAEDVGANESSDMLVNAKLDEGYADTTWYLRHRNHNNANAFSGRNGSAAEVKSNHFANFNILETEDPEDGDYNVFSIFDQ